MKKTILFLFGSLCSLAMYSQCTTTNATSCQCDTATQVNCDLLPDITISWYALENYAGGPSEFSQTGNGVDNGRLKVTGSTPNIGHGPLTVRGQDASGMRKFVCGTDTFSASATGTFTCPNGDPLPKQIVWQRIYHKNGSTMTWWDREAGAMTYHPAHNHIHNDAWGTFTLRIEDPSDPNPLNWSIVGSGKKLGFCLMDYYQCSSASATNHCKDDNTVYNQGTTLLNGDFPNWQLGGGGYGCSVIEQGISSGYTDVYSESLDGMWINIPPGTCNGQYWIVYEADPNDYFVEESESNNYTAIPFTLTQQSPAGSPVVQILPEGSPNVCAGDSAVLIATAGMSYLWSTGATTQRITAGPGTYTVTVTNYCGTATSAPFTVTQKAVPPAPVVTPETVCAGMAATLNATGSNLTWLDSSGNVAGTGSSFTTPLLNSTATYWVQDEAVYTGNIGYTGKPDSTGAGAYSSSSNYCMFDVYRPLTIKSVQVYSGSAGPRTVQLFDEIGIILAAGTFNIPAGPSRVDLDFYVTPGKNYSMRVTGNANLWRSSGGVSYPYTMQDTLSITTSSAGAAYYYFFYDWEVEVGGATCPGPLVPVTAVVEVCTDVHGLDLSGNIDVFPNPSEGNFTFRAIMPAPADIDISVTDLSGRNVYSRRLENATGEVSEPVVLADVAKGIYMMSVLIDGKLYYRKLVVQ